MTNPEFKASSHDRKQRMLRGSVFMTLSPVTSLFLGILISVLINWYIPTETYGIFSWFSTINSIFITVIPFQLAGAVSRYLAVARGSNNQEEVDSLLKANSVFALILVPVSGLAALVVTPFVFDVFIGIGGQYEFVDVVILAIGVMSFSLATFSTGPMMGFQKFEKVGIAQFLANISGQITVISMLIFGLGIHSLLTKWVVVSLLTVSLLTIFSKRIWSLRGKMYPLRPLIKYSYPAIIAFLFGFFFLEFLIRIIFQSFGDELGLYQFAVRMFSFVNALRLGFYVALGSYYSEAVGRGDTKILELEVQWTMKISFFIFLPLLVGVVITAPAVFLILFENYYWSYQYFAILMSGLFFTSFGQPYVSILSAKAKTMHVLAISVISSGVSGVLMLLAVYFGMGFVGTGLLSNIFLLIIAAYISSRFFYALLSGLWVRRLVGISLSIRQVLPLIATAACMLFPAALIHLLRLPPLIELLAILCVCIPIYMIPIRLFNIVSENEIRKASLFLPKRLSTPFSNTLVWIFVRRGKKRT